MHRKVKPENLNAQEQFGHLGVLIGGKQSVSRKRGTTW